jgi:hypothetical protein
MAIDKRVRKVAIEMRAAHYDALLIADATDCALNEINSDLHQLNHMAKSVKPFG